MKHSTTNYGTPSIGCYLDHANYNNDELSARMIDIAVRRGMEIDADLATLLAMTDEEIAACDDYSEQMSDASDSATDWLNSQETRSFLYWANEGEANAFGLWPNIDGAKEDCGFVSHRGQEYPLEGEDFTGEWLHINDHGNCTLYVREAREGSGYFDREIWSVV